MKKTYKLEDLDCANCALKIEDAIRKIDGVKDVSVNFIMQHLTLEADDEGFEEVLKRAIKAAKKAERSCRIIVQ
ncbi:MAG TPA: cation transporter [Bacillota bacterium]|nr:cation transporter [Bacillota bacterium]